MTRAPQRVVPALMFALVLVAGCHRHSAGRDQNGTGQGIPRDAARFSIAASNDSTVMFKPAEARWLRAGMRGHAVDPLQRDALIARLTIVSVDTSGVVATITGKISQVATTHVVLVVHPKNSWWRDRRFWYGIIGGATVGAVAGTASR